MNDLRRKPGLINDDFGTQIGIMIFLCLGFLGFYKNGFEVGLPILDVFFVTAKPYAFWIGILALVGIVVNLFLMVCYPTNVNQRRTVHYRIMRAYLHLSVLLVELLVFGWIVALSWIGLVVLGVGIWLSLVIVALFIFILIIVQDILVKKYFNITWWNIFYWVK